MINLNNISITTIHSILTVYNYSDRIYSTRSRGTYGLSFCLNGQITYHHKGNQYICDPYHAVLLPKGAEYWLCGNKSGYFPLINFDCTDSFQTSEFHLIPLSDPDTYLRDYEEMRHLYLFPRNRTRILNILYGMISRLCNETNGERNILAPAIAYLKQHYIDPSLTNAVLAEKVHISERYFHKLFLQCYGTTPGQYLSDIRIRKAKQLLAGSDYTVTYVAEVCGFSSIYHFSRAFKGICGDTPTEFRKKSEQARI